MPNKKQAMFLHFAYIAVLLLFFFFFVRYYCLVVVQLFLLASKPIISSPCPPAFSPILILTQATHIETVRIHRQIMRMLYYCALHVLQGFVGGPQPTTGQGTTNNKRATTTVTTRKRPTLTTAACSNIYI